MLPRAQTAEDYEALLPQRLTPEQLAPRFGLRGVPGTLRNICLKELRETRIWLLMIVKANLLTPASRLEPLLDETDRLISIFVTSIKTAQQKSSS